MNSQINAHSKTEFVTIPLITQYQMLERQGVQAGGAATPGNPQLS